MLIVLIGNSRFKYKITIVKAVNTALKVISLAFKAQPPPNIYYLSLYKKYRELLPSVLF